MRYSDGKKEFIETWGKLAINWGENRTIGQVHALLMIACNPLCTDDIMEELNISRGNANGTVHHLLEMGIIHKVHLEGERKTFFLAEKDMWKVFQAVVSSRKEKELDPMIDTLDRLTNVNGSCEQSREFCRTIKELKEFSIRVDQVLGNFGRKEINWMMRSIGRMMMR